MQINKINDATNQKSFGASLIISVPKSLYPQNWSDIQVEKHFNTLVNSVVTQKPRTLKEKILNATGLRPEIISFIHYPGFKHVENYLKNGKSWVENRLNFKYGLRTPAEKLDIELPDIDCEDYKFFCLTNKERDYYLAQGEEVKEKVDRAVKSIIYHINEHAGKVMEDEDVKFTKAIARVVANKQAFEAASEGNQWTLEVKKLEDLTEILKA